MSQQPINFNAGQLAFIAANRHTYRVFVLPSELLFVKVGTGYRGTENIQIGKYELVSGGLAAIGLVRTKQKVAAVRQKIEELDKASLEDLRGMAKFAEGGIHATPDDMTDVSLDPPSWLVTWTMTPAGNPYAGILRFKHAKLGNLKFELFEGDDARTALKELPKVLGARIRINAKWTDEKNRLVKLPPG